MKYYLVNLLTGEFSPETFINTRMAKRWAQIHSWFKFEIMEVV
jgi:hypothetical protein